MGELLHILNWRRWDENITLSGQPSEAQLEEIRSLGATHIVNLAPHTNKGALGDETKTVSDLGMSYIHIPVDFENPTDQNFADFLKAMDRLAGKTAHVHCIYNARVSAFFYRYAKEKQPNSVSNAYTLMDSIWKPGGVWAQFIGAPEDVHQPNRYAGDDY